MKWIDFFTNQGIDYVTSGPNTKKGEISIRCPYCGEDDPSQHMSLSLTAEKWACWRDAEHRGRAPYRLIQAILGCTYAYARTIVRQYNEADPDGLLDALKLLEPAPTAPVGASAVRLAEREPIQPAGTTARFWHYLKVRGFDPAWAIKRYNLTCCQTGHYKDRMIIPIYDTNNHFVGWTGRAIQPTISAPRYLASSVAIKKTLFNLPNLTGGKLLFVVEGPFDAMKMETAGVHATCCFGTSMTMDQLGVLNDLRYQYSRVVILFDKDAVPQALAASEWFCAENVSIECLPGGAKDPGSMTTESIRQWLNVHS